jgi:hypothetical protein
MRLGVQRPAVSAISTSMLRARAACRPSKITAAGSAPACCAMMGHLLRSRPDLELLARRGAKRIARPRA